MTVFSVPWFERPTTFAWLSTGRIEANPDELPMPVTSTTLSSLMTDLTSSSSFAGL